MSRSVSSEIPASKSDVSRTSTYLYAQEPFETFQHRVRALCTSLWPSVSSDAISISHMFGGSYNRVIGITISTPRTLGEENSIDGHIEYVLRIPRYAGTRIEPELATLAFVQNNTTIPVPAVVVFDPTRRNPIEHSYNIQSKMPGVRLDDIYKTLSRTERLSITRQLAEILRDMHRVRSPTPGFLDASKFVARHADVGGGLVPEVRVVGFGTNIVGLKGSRDPRHLEAEAKPKSTCQLLVDQFDGWQAFDLRNNCREKTTVEFYGRLRALTRKMERLGFLDDSETSFALFHPDFAPRNILAHKVDQGSGENPIWKISAVLDWDRTGFMPWPVVCTPPTWIWSDSWGDSGEDDEDEAVLWEVPEDPEFRERKELFDSLMGAAYTDHAYSAQCRFVRRLFSFASYGFNTYQQYQYLDRFYEEWNEAYGPVGEAPEVSASKKKRLFWKRASNSRGKLRGCCCVQ